MVWDTQRGGPWGGGGSGGGGGGGPWGGGSSGPQPPDLEEMLRRGQDRFKRFMPGGVGGGRRITLLVAAAIVVWLATGFYVIQPDEQGVPLVFGEAKKATLPGINYNWPAPIGRVFKPRVTRINQVRVGFRGGTDSRGFGGGNIVTQESLMLTGDENIINIRFVTLWRINDAEKYLFNIRNPEETVKAASESAMREIIGKTDFEFARTQGRVRLQQEVRPLIQKILDDYGSGIEVTDVNLQQVEPPGTVLDSFRDVQAARADKERATNEATAYLNEVTQRAEGEAAKILNEAEAYKQEKIAVATGESERFLSILEQYRVEKDVTRRRIYLETMRSVLGGMDKVLIDNSGGGSGVVPYLPLPELQKNRSQATPPAGN